LPTKEGKEPIRCASEKKAYSGHQGQGRRHPSDKKKDKGGKKGSVFVLDIGGNHDLPVLKEQGGLCSAEKGGRKPEEKVPCLSRRLAREKKRSDHVEKEERRTEKETILQMDET